jgi:hypothetical protein
MTRTTSEAADPDADGPSSGAFYVGARVGRDEPPGGAGAARPCVHCGEPVWVDANDVAFADSCAAVACSDCTGTADGILYIAP